MILFITTGVEIKLHHGGKFQHYRNYYHYPFGLKGKCKVGNRKEISKKAE